MAKRIYVTDKVLLTYRRNNNNSISSTYRNVENECIKKNLTELKLFLVDKRLFNLYEKSFQKITIHF